MTVEQLPAPDLTDSLVENRFKTAIKSRQRQIGLWSSLCSNIVAEVIAGAGFSWVLIDAEHAPNELSSVLLQLQAMRGGTAEAVVRPAANDPVLIKRLLDIGARSLMIPQVRCADEARNAISATRYPPHGIRGVSVSQRANRFSRDREYFRRVNDDLCVLIQIETRPALQTVDEIADVTGVDGLFVGPSDLAAELGHFGDAGHPDVQRAFDRVLAAADRAGKPAGILAPVESDADHYLKRGFSFVAVGSDLGLLVKGCDALVHRFA
ncbi:MAG: HpcH/HpaI aldolase/citrate lyase family protein [Parvibaculaceae bacterium]